MKTFPDKHTYKTTITARLREQIASLGGQDKSYLELGCDVGYTTVSVSEHFKRCCGVDIDPHRIIAAKNNAADNCEFFAGTAQAVQKDRWDVVLIDADHSYDSVSSDFATICSKLTPGQTIIIFHDYGLVAAGVKKFVSELESAGAKIEFLGERDSWNPLGGAVSDYEAAMMILQIE